MQISIIALKVMLILYCIKKMDLCEMNVKLWKEQLLPHCIIITVMLRTLWNWLIHNYLKVGINGIETTMLT